MDRITPEQRSLLMSKIKSKNTTPEKLMFQALKDAGIKYRKHYKLLGNPDIAFPKQKIAIFIDGDFWHGGSDYKKRKERLPEYWVNKIQRNIRRDRRYRTKLRQEGWVVLRLWESKIIKNPAACLAKIVQLFNTYANSGT